MNKQTETLHKEPGSSLCYDVQSGKIVYENFFVEAEDIEFTRESLIKTGSAELDRFESLVTLYNFYTHDPVGRVNLALERFEPTYSRLLEVFEIKEENSRVLSEIKSNLDGIKDLINGGGLLANDAALIVHDLGNAFTPLIGNVGLLDSELDVDITIGAIVDSLEPCAQKTQEVLEWFNPAHKLEVRIQNIAEREKSIAAKKIKGGFDYEIIVSDPGLSSLLCKDIQSALSLSGLLGTTFANIPGYNKSDNPNVSIEVKKNSDGDVEISFIDNGGIDPEKAQSLNESYRNILEKQRKGASLKDLMEYFPGADSRKSGSHGDALGFIAAGGIKVEIDGRLSNKENRNGFFQVTYTLSKERFMWCEA